jgi:hypothetical protein|tara:strand:- start:733 stop:1593 length:861 start_codon:yes stop_codon:yes gene_type:complete
MTCLNTLVDDINKSLEDLSDGTPLNISEEDLDLTLSRIKTAILEWSDPSERNSNFSLRMSNIGKPARQLWFEKNKPIENTRHSAATQIKFLYGHILEEIVLMLVRAAGHTVTDEQKEVELNGIKGHMDCKIDGEVVDIKTASKFAFAKFKNGNLHDDDPFGYIPQLAAYEKAEDTCKGGFLVINKEGGDLCLHKPDDLSKPNINTVVSNITKALDSKIMPPVCYDPIPEGKKGNMKIHRNCVYCPYKFECFKDSNNGKGLRVFKYANRLEYLTKINVEPRVEEILK